MPKHKWDGYNRFCPFARALDVVGERWTLVILHNLLGGPARYTDLKTGLPGISSNVLSDRLRKLEAAGVIRRRLGEVADGVQYEMTKRGEELAPAMAELRRWGAAELLAEADPPRFYDHSHVIPAELRLDDTFEWRIDDRRLWLIIEGRILRLHSSSPTAPSVVMRTSLDFMRVWAAGETSWDNGRASGEVEVTGSEEAWDRMLVATQYPGRPSDLTGRILATLSE